MSTEIQYIDGLTASITVNMAPGEGTVWTPEMPHIDWGDGQISTCERSGTYLHTYSNYGSYYITLSGVNDHGGNCSHTKSLSLVEPPKQITCDNGGCELLKRFDSDGDGIISEHEWWGAEELMQHGDITEEEFDFVYGAYKAGSINAVCPSCCEMPWSIPVCSFEIN